MSRAIALKTICVLLLISIIVLNFSTKSEARFSMSYLYGNYDYISLVERTNGALNEVSPSYFDLNADGSLKLNKVDSNLVNKMHEKGITVVPFLSNHWDRSKGRNALRNADKLVNSIVTAINKYNLDGVNVDLENLTETDRSLYVKLVKKLREKIPSDKVVAVAVAPNPYSWNTGWQGSYDYAELAKYADYLMLMAYDEHYEGGEAGSVASIDFVEKSIKYALKYVDNEKLVLGIPFYGRYWQSGADVGGYGVTNTKIEEIVKNYNSVVTFDKETATVKATVTIKSGDLYPVINGRALKAGKYTFWYENEESISKKLELINKYDLKGCGSWSLGQENADTWEYYANVLNKDSDEFYDVTEKHWAYDAIYYAKEKAWVQGRSENRFEPNGELTRAEFATILCRVLGYDLTGVSNYYSDVKGHWASNSINILSQAKLMNGYESGLFMPDKAITREEVAKVLYYLMGDSVDATGNAFVDVSNTRWSYQYINKLSGLGIVNGYDTGEFKPEKSISRAEFVTILKRAF